MAFENLSDKLSGVFKRLRSKGKLSEADVKAAMVMGPKVLHTLWIIMLLNARIEN